MGCKGSVEAMPKLIKTLNDLKFKMGLNRLSPFSKRQDVSWGRQEIFLPMGLRQENKARERNHSEALKGP